MMTQFNDIDGRICLLDLRDVRAIVSETDSKTLFTSVGGFTVTNAEFEASLRAPLAARLPGDF